jgi:hypothetical protein
VYQAAIHFDPFGDSYNFGGRKVHSICAECTTGMEIALAHPMVLLCNVCRVEACFGLFGDSVSLGAR